ncbi:hypothetical protein Taro_049005 [Colocasia esculenta]|uniref:Uncharacterized protein n=1 Tax=Colocasia esculenta TaxID=4460 RepID=A0A843X9R9_COLES|nr:hypothetical protein [Colocasia esculenta]
MAALGPLPWEPPAMAAQGGPPWPPLLLTPWLMGLLCSRGLSLKPLSPPFFRRFLQFQCILQRALTVESRLFSSLQRRGIRNGIRGR